MQNTTSFTLEGTQSEGETLEVHVDGSPVAVISDPSGSWSHDLTGLADGVYVIQVVARDGAGNETQSPAISLTVDTQPPSLSFDGPSGAVAPGDTVTLTGTVEADATVAISGATTGMASVTGTSWSLVHGAVSGTSTLNWTATATDQAGNTATASHSVTPAYPVATVTHPNRCDDCPNGWFESGGHPGCSGGCPGGATYLHCTGCYAINGAPSTGGTGGALYCGAILNSSLTAYRNGAAATDVTWNTPLAGNGYSGAPSTYPRDCEIRQPVPPCFSS